MEPTQMFRTLARTRALPILAWFYVAALGVQVFFAGMYVFVGASNIELHRNMAHVLGITTILMLGAAFVGRSPHRRLTLGVLGLLIVQGMLVHVGQWFGLWTIAALHPVNALVLTYAAYTLARRSSEAWAEGRTDAAPAPSSLTTEGASA
jgi:hypothetical protein